MLKVTHVSKKFKDADVLKDVSLTVKPGELIHIVGINGSGKSTLFKIITGLLKADSGTVSLDSGDVIGALIENPGFLEYETAWDNLRFLANVHHKFQADKVKKLLTDFDLDPNSRQAIGKYSIGMRQKVGIVQAIMEDQNIILLDEPTRGIDKKGVKQFVDLLERLKAEDKAVVVASHDDIPGLVYDRTLTLENGELN
ncbi:MAG: ATP-binding cassette domain-containing protein [Lactobacillus equicursoris]|uniref:ATP-binding cassette domain-containing protein n=1 Tax=Lactobacillus equicursoris TaxID=420645 RepID=UPI00242CBC00|nr:ATP-binding cassette domain-containing protein [Lactobacillus equicursoris]MDD6406908.1 ATP-binding cassette domain-containing protein [Lactobacillus equicursoris]